MAGRYIVVQQGLVHTSYRNDGEVDLDRSIRVLSNDILEPFIVRSDGIDGQG